MPAAARALASPAHPAEWVSQSTVNNRPESPPSSIPLTIKVISILLIQIKTYKKERERERKRRKVLDRSSALTRISGFKVAGREKSRLLYPSQQFLLFISPLYSFFSLVVVICIISQCVRVHNKNENENYTTTANRRLTKKNLPN